MMSDFGASTGQLSKIRVISGQLLPQAFFILFICESIFYDIVTVDAVGLQALLRISWSGSSEGHEPADAET